jgi:hypothetical protein
MSGGSFNYLGSMPDDAEELAKRQAELGQMADALAALDDGRLAARHTRDVLRLLRGVEQLGSQLGDVWHAVEWWYSCDSSEKQAHEALAEYNAQYGQPGDQQLSWAKEQQSDLDPRMTDRLQLEGPMGRRTPRGGRACADYGDYARRPAWTHHGGIDPPWWWKPWIGPLAAIAGWWHRPRPVKP